MLRRAFARLPDAAGLYLRVNYWLIAWQLSARATNSGHDSTRIVVVVLLDCRPLFRVLAVALSPNCLANSWPRPNQMNRRPVQC